MASTLRVSPQERTTFCVRAMTSDATRKPVDV
jgi:hypothetical protein